jgi:superfamily I DNA and/or RNA helicase
MEYNDEYYYWGKERKYNSRYKDDSDEEKAGYVDVSDESSSLETSGLLISNPKLADGEQEDHHQSGSYIFNGIILSWSIEDIENDRLNLFRKTETLPTAYEGFSRTVMEEYYEKYKPFILEDARATIASGLESKRKKSDTHYSVKVSDVQMSRNTANPCKMEVDQDILDKTEGKSRVAVLLNPVKHEKSVSILGLASQHGFGNKAKKTIIKFIADENMRYTYNGVFIKGTQWKIRVLGSVLSHERIYEACTLKPELTFLPQVICGRASQLPDVRQTNYSSLNASQAKAISGFSNAENGIYLLQGPPGTGKTSTIVDLIFSLSAQKNRTLICAPSNKAVQVIADRFYQKYKDQNLAVLLVGVESKIPELLLPVFLHTWSQQLTNLLQEMKNVIVGPEGFLPNQKGKNDAQPSTNLQVIIDKFNNKLGAVKKLMGAYRIDNYSRDLNSIFASSADYLRRLSAEGSAFWLCVYDYKTEETKGLSTQHRQYNQTQELIQQAWQNLILTIRKDKKLEDMLLENADVIFSTLSVAGRKQMRQTKKVDILIVDEAGQSIEAETLIPFILQPKKCLLVGDTKQLPATVISQTAEKMGYGKSMLYRLLEECKQPFHMLDTQYRMHPSIRSWPSMQFYHDRIIDGPNIRSRNTPFPTLTSAAHQPYAFIHTVGKESSEGTSYCNLNEAKLIANFIGYLSQYHKVKPDTQVGIITFYAGQARLIQKELPKRFKPRISTVDGFQGDENEIIIISFVRSNSNNTVGFLHDFRRLNVAITRGRHAVIMFGDVNTLKADKNLKSLLSHLENQKLIFSQSDFEKTLLPDSKKTVPIKQVGGVEAERKPVQSKPLPDNYKTALCKKHKSGNCRHGSKCHFAHGKAELVKNQKRTTFMPASTPTQLPQAPNITTPTSASKPTTDAYALNEKPSQTPYEASVTLSALPKTSMPKMAQLTAVAPDSKISTDPYALIGKYRQPSHQTSATPSVLPKASLPEMAQLTAVAPASKTNTDPYSLIGKSSQSTHQISVTPSLLPKASLPEIAQLTAVAPDSKTSTDPYTLIGKYRQSSHQTSATPSVLPRASLPEMTQLTAITPAPKTITDPYELIGKYNPSSHHTSGTPSVKAMTSLIEKYDGTSPEIVPSMPPSIESRILSNKKSITTVYALIKLQFKAAASTVATTETSKTTSAMKASSTPPSVEGRDLSNKKSICTAYALTKAQPIPSLKSEPSTHRVLETTKLLIATQAPSTAPLKPIASTEKGPLKPSKPYIPAEKTGKMKMFCRFFANGNCNKGTHCEMSHIPKQEGPK